MKYLLIGDIHLSDRPPSSCMESYTEDILTILEHTVQLETDLKVDGVVWSGDVFHNKQANRNSHKLVQRAIDIVQSYKNLWIVPGNHDMQSDRYESLFETQPLGILFKAGAKLLNGWEESGLHPLYGIPWQQKWDQVTVEKCFEEWHRRVVLWTSELPLVVAHAPLYPPGQELEWENFPTGEWATIQGSGYCYYGHVHEAHDIYQVTGHRDQLDDIDSLVTFCNQGAITRGSLHESELNRKIAVTTWAPDEGFVRVDVPHKPADEVFKLMEKYEEKDKKIVLDEFLESVGAAQIEITSIETVIDYIRSLGLDEDIVKLAVELLESNVK